MALTDTSIRNAKPRERDYKMADGGGLFLLVTPVGGKLWRLKFRLDGREKKLALGSYPEITLAEARKRREAAREQLANGTDPAREKQRAKQLRQVAADNTFAIVGRECLDKRKHEGMAPATLEKAEYHLGLLTGKLGTLPVADITAPEVLAVLRPYDNKGRHETAKRLLQLAGRIFRYAVATARLVSDPTRDLKDAITAPKFKHFAAILEPKRVGERHRPAPG